MAVEFYQNNTAFNRRLLTTGRFVSVRIPENFFSQRVLLTKQGQIPNVVQNPIGLLVGLLNRSIVTHYRR